MKSFLEKNKEKERINDAIVTLLFYLSKRDDTLPVEYYVLIPIDVDETFDGEFYFTISSPKKHEWENKKLKLTNIYIEIPLDSKEMTVDFDGLYDSKEEGIYDGDYFTFDEIIEKDELLDFIKP